MEVKELWHISQSESVIKNNWVDEDSVEIVIQSNYSLISAGTERIISTGRVPKQIAPQMRVPYMKGDFTFPVSYGYSLAGKIIKGPQELMNRNVHIMHPHHDFALVKKEDIFFIPDSIPRKRAIFASNMETVVNAIWDSNLQLGDRVMVVGFGAVGALLALTLSQFPGVELKIKDNNKARKKFAKDCGLELFEDVKESKAEFDICFHCSGNENGLQFCIDQAKPEGKIIELSWYGNKKVKADLGNSFHTDRKKIIGSQVSSIPNDKKASWDFKKRKNLVFKLLQNKIYDRLPCLEIPFEDSPHYLKKLRNGFFDEPGLIIHYSSEFK